jgi:hypothetical protein
MPLGGVMPGMGKRKIDIHQPQRANIAPPPREWARTHPDERVGVSEGPGDRLLQLLLDVVLAPNVAPQHLRPA